MASVGSAFVDIKPEMSGFSGALQSGMGSLGGLAKTLGGNMGKVIGIGSVAGVVGGLLKLGDEFEKSYKTIQVGTGATGKQLDGLEKSFKNVAKSGPSSFSDVSTAITGVRQRLDLTGKPLETLSTKFLQLSRLTGTDLKTNIASVSDTLHGFNIPASGAGKAMDEMFRASQATGVPLATLNDTVKKFRVPLTEMGFGFDQSLALVGKFSKEGLNTDKVMGAMSIGLGKMAKAGEDPKQAFSRLTESIKGAKTITEANGIAIHLFGMKAGPQLADAIRSGKFEIGDLTKTIASGSSTIQKSADHAKTWGGSWKTTMNMIKVAVEPVAMWMVGALNTGFRAFGAALTWLIDKLGPTFTKIAKTVKETFGDISDDVSAFVDIIRQGFNDGANPTLHGFLGVLSKVGLYAREVFEGFRFVFTGKGLGEQSHSPLMLFVVHLGDTFKSVGAWIKDHWKPILEGAGAVLLIMVSPVAAVIAALVLLYVKFSWFRDVVATVISFIKDHWQAFAVVFVVALFGIVGALVLAYAKFSWFRNVIAAVVSFIRDNWQAVLGGAAAVVLAVVVPMLIAWTTATIANAAAALALAAAWVVAMAPVVLAVAGIALLVGALIYAYEHFSWFKTGVNAAWAAIKIAFDYAWGFIKAVFDGIVIAILNYVVPAFQGMWNAIQYGWHFLQEVFNYAWGFIKATFDGIGIAIIGTIHFFETMWHAIVIAWDGVKSAFDAAWGFIKATFDWIATAIIGTIHFFETMWHAIVIAWDGVKSAFDAAWGFIKSVFDSIYNAIMSVVLPVFRFFAAVVGGITTLIVALIHDMWRIMSGIFNEIAAAIVGPLQAAFQFLLSVARIVWGGIQSAIQVAWNGVQTIWGAIQTYIFGPLQAAFQFLLSVARIVWDAIRSAIQASWSFIQVIWGAIQTYIVGPLQAAFQFLQDLVARAWDAIKSAVATASAFLRGVWDSMIGFITGVFTSTWTTLQSTVTGVWDGIKSGIASAWSFISDIFNKIHDFVAGALTSVWGPFQNAAEGAWNAIPGTMRSALKVIGGLVGGFLGVVGDIADKVGLTEVAKVLHGASGAAKGWGMATGGQIPASEVGAGFITNGPRAIVGEGNQAHPEFVIPTDPTHRKRALDLYQSLGFQLMDAGGVLGDITGFAGDVVSGGADLLSSGADWVKDNVVDVFRRIAAGALDKLWPKLSQPDGLAGMPSAGINTARSGVIDFIRGEVAKKQAAMMTNAANSGRLDHLNLPDAGGVLTGLSTAGMNPEFVHRLLAMSAALHTAFNIQSGYRDSAKQAALYDDYIHHRNNQAVTAVPGTSMHEKGLAADIGPGRSWLAGREGMFGMHFTVPSEDWHIEPIFAAAAAASGGPPPSGAVSDWIAQAIGLTGVPGSWSSGLATLVQRESGGDPHSINLTDSNARKGTPSKGLAQTIDPTFQQYMVPGHGDIWNPVDNLASAIRYIQSRYGDISRVQQANPNLPPQGYAMGGMLPTWHPASFDVGGTLSPGWNVVRNDTGNPETLRPVRGGPALHIEHATFADQVDVDSVLQKADFMVRAGRL